MKALLNIYPLALFLGTLSAVAQGTGKGSAKVETEPDNLFQSVPHLKVDFEQESFRKLRGRTVRRAGLAQFSQPSFFRWQYSHQKFGLEEYYYDGKNFTHYIQRENAATVYDSKTNLGKELQQVVDLVLKNKNLRDRFTVQKNGKDRKNDQLDISLIPKKGQYSDIEKIHVVILDKKQFIQTVNITYKDGNRTKFLFSNPKFSKISPDTYRFTPSANVKVNVIK